MTETPSELWYAVQDGSWDWDVEEAPGIFVLARSPQEAVEKAVPLMVAKDGDNADGGDLKVAEVGLIGFSGWHRAEDGAYQFDDFIAFDPTPTDRALNDICLERWRQVEEEGWSPEHDDAHANGELARAGACYALASFYEAHRQDNGTPVGWPWEARWWKPKDARRDLVRAAALIVAEIERLDRRAAKTGAA